MTRDHDSITQVDDLHELHGDLTPRVPPLLERPFHTGGTVERVRAWVALILNPLDLGVVVIERQLATVESFEPTPRQFHVLLRNTPSPALRMGHFIRRM